MMKRKILVDADACPVAAEICRVARHVEMEAAFFSDRHRILDLPDGAIVTYINPGPQAVDLALWHAAAPGDIAITQDHGLACLLLGKKVTVVTPSGMIINDRNIEGLIERRHLAMKERRLGRRTRGPRPFSLEQRERFVRNLEKAARGKEDVEGN